MEEKVKKTRKSFSNEFKNEAIELSKRIGVSKAASELGIESTYIRLWKRKVNNSNLKSSANDKLSYQDLEKEVRRPAKENGYLKEINNVLKKAPQYFRWTIWEV